MSMTLPFAQTVETPGSPLQLPDHLPDEEVVHILHGQAVNLIGKFDAHALVGAVTHVLVNDPTRGYGIFAQTMLEQAEQVATAEK